MIFEAEQLAELKKVFPGVKQFEEGGFVYFLLPSIKLPENCTPDQVDALFCPMDRDGYPSRLFFSQQVQPKTSRNWNAVNIRILERNWFAFSWTVPPSGLSLVNVIGAHLRALAE